MPDVYVATPLDALPLASPTTASQADSSFTWLFEVNF